MEKLEPVLKQKFWILLGVAILMTFIGWWMATSSMAALTTSRTTEIDNSFKSVPSGEIPNKTWAQRLSVVNTEQEKSIKAAQLAMWKRQQARMTWPDGIEPVNGYWGRIPNDMRELFRDSYLDEVMQVWKTLNPMIEETGTGVVKFPFPAMVKVLNKGPWPRTPPDSEVMWEAREDLWLLKGLFESITSMNGGMDGTRADAVIHTIDRLELRGGGEKTSSGGASAGASADGMASMGTMGSMGSMGAMGNAPGLGGGGAMGHPGGGPTVTSSLGLSAVPVEFDPTEEFGDDGNGSGTLGGGTTGGNMGMAMMGSMAAMGADTSATAPAEKKINRYIPGDPSRPFKTRGFYISLKMDHQKIPLLIEELSSNEKSVWPIEVVRVQMARINEDDSVPGGSFGGGAGGSGSGPNRMMMMQQRGMQSSMAAGITGGPTALGVGGKLDEDPFAAFGQSKPTASGDVDKVNAAKAALENALKDPVMAQVTIAGIFTLYQKVDEPAETAPAATPNTEEAPPEVTKPDSEATGEQAATEPAVEATDSGESKDTPSDTPAAKPEATIEPKPEVKSEENQK